MDWLKGQGDMLVRLAEEILKCVPPDGIPGEFLYAAVMGKVSLHGYIHLLGALGSLKAVVISEVYVTRGPKYFSVLNQIKRKEPTDGQ